MASPIRVEDFMPQLHVGNERIVYFHTESLGIKISRHTDGYVRVLSVTPYRPTNGEKVREGDIHEGDVVREVSDVNLRMPIDSAVWKLTVGLIKMAPRPLKFVVARELQMSEEGELVVEGTAAAAADAAGRNNNMQEGAGNHPTSSNTRQKPSPPSCHDARSNAARTDDIARFGPTREIHFFESCLGVKLHHTPEGYVQILSVTPYKSFPSSPMANARTGDIYAGDVVLEVGGVWDLREPIEAVSWGVLIKFIRETGRPLCMVVADGGSLKDVTSEEEEEEEENQVGESDARGINPEKKEVHNELNNDKSDEDEVSEKEDQPTPELCKALDGHLSLEALQRELEKDT
ncbi:hypothetical protein ACHAXR_005311 [Thalassiosira sp. AJA248-18]